jgi:EpsI family protein
MTYSFGKPAAEGTWHEVSGWLVYVVALALLIGVDLILRKIFRARTHFQERSVASTPSPLNWRRVAPVATVLIVAGIFVNWFTVLPEPHIPRRPLSELPAALGDWRQKGSEFKFDVQTESVLRTTDYTLREYTSPEGRIANIYVGYYGSQRTGATYHSPQNCLPGAGWVMYDHTYVDIAGADGRTFRANRYLIRNGMYTEVMLYWYQGRGRFEASEYVDKINTIWDSVLLGRSDGAMVRVVTGVGNDIPSAESAAVDIAGKLAQNLAPYIP